MSKLSIKSKVSEQLHNFANETSIHGICFVAQPEQPKFKRAIWFVLVSVSLVYAAYQITSVLTCMFLISLKQLVTLQPFDLQQPSVTLLKDLDLVIKIFSAQENGRILKMAFTLSKQPHLHRPYSITISRHFLLALCIQLLTSDYIRLLNKPYVNGVTLREQNQPLKCYQPLELLTQLKRGLDLSKLKIWGL